MTESNIIIMVVTITFASTFGVYVAIKKINQYTRTPMNTLNRETGDIELMDYIEPTYPGQTYYPLDLTIPQNINMGEHYENGRIYYYYYTNDPIFINSSLEKTIYIEFIWCVIFIIIIILIFYLIISFYTGYNKKKIVFTKGISTDIITFTEDYQELLSRKITDGINYYITYENPEYYFLPHHWTVFNIKDWLETLNEQDYAVTFHLSSVPSEKLYYNTPEIILTNEFIVNKSSNSNLISVLLYQQLDYFYNSFQVGYYENYSIVIRYKALTAYP